MARKLRPDHDYIIPIVPAEIGQRALLIYFSNDQGKRVNYTQPKERNLQSCQEAALLGLQNDEDLTMAEVVGVGFSEEVYARYYQSDARPWYVVWKPGRGQAEEMTRFIKRKDAFRFYQETLATQKYLDVSTNSFPIKKVREVAR